MSTKAVTWHPERCWCDCLNTEAGAGFFSCTIKGYEVPVTSKEWQAQPLYRCGECGAIMNAVTNAVEVPGDLAE
jgi:hypothetical protein